MNWLVTGMSGNLEAPIPEAGGMKFWKPPYRTLGVRFPEAPVAEAECEVS